MRSSLSPPSQTVKVQAPAWMSLCAPAPAPSTSETATTGSALAAAGIDAVLLMAILPARGLALSFPSS